MPADYLLTDIAQYRRETWRWQALMGVAGRMQGGFTRFAARTTAAGSATSG